MAAPLINSSLSSLVVSLMDMTGRVAATKLHSRIFDTYEQKSLVLLLKLPPAPGAHPTSSDAVVASWEELVALHKPTQTYQLLPRRCRTLMAFGVVKAICEEPGSPFSMDHRVEPYDYRFLFRPDRMDAIKAWSHEERNRQFESTLRDGIMFDGLLQAPGDVGLVLGGTPYLSEKLVRQAAANVAYARDQLLTEMGGANPIKDKWRTLLAKGRNVHIFAAGEKSSSPSTLLVAKQFGVHCYLRQGAHFKFQPSPYAAVAPRAGMAAAAAGAPVATATAAVGVATASAAPSL